MARDLSHVWKRRHLRSGLWIFVAGYENKEARFWYVNNTSGPDKHTGLYKTIGAIFRAVDDLDGNYIRRIRSKSKCSKQQILQTTAFSFRNGFIYPFADIYDHFSAILKSLTKGGGRGFGSAPSLERYAFIARQRLEFVKRLYSKSHGIYREAHAPIAGRVHVHAVSPGGTTYVCHKNEFRRA